MWITKDICQSFSFCDGEVYGLVRDVHSWWRTRGAVVCLWVVMIVIYNPPILILYLVILLYYGKLHFMS